MVVTHGVQTKEQTCKWKFKHCFLLGTMDQIQLLELIGYKTLTFEIHDRDQKQLIELKKEKNLIQIESVGNDSEEEEDLE